MMRAGAPWWHWLRMAGVWMAGIALIVRAVTALVPNQPQHDPRPILDERFARGELDVGEYRQRRDELHTRTRPAERAHA